MDHLDIARFTTAQAAAAAGITAGTLAAQFRREDIALAPDETPETRNPGTGRSRLFTARRVLHIALTQRLAALGLPVATASRLALAFTDHGGVDDAAGTLSGDAMPEPRPLGRPFGDDITLLELTFGAGEPTIAIRRHADVLRRPAFGAGATVALIDLDDLYRCTLSRLGIAV